MHRIISKKMFDVPVSEETSWTTKTACTNKHKIHDSFLWKADLCRFIVDAIMPMRHPYELNRELNIPKMEREKNIKMTSSWPPECNEQTVA